MNPLLKTELKNVLLFKYFGGASKFLMSNLRGRLDQSKSYQKEHMSFLLLSKYTPFVNHFRVHRLHETTV